MSKKTSTCLYIDKNVLETARLVGLSVSKVAENGLKDAVARLRGSGRETGPRNPSDHDHEGRGRDLNPGARLHRPIGYQATSPRPLFRRFGCLFSLSMLTSLSLLISVSSETQGYPSDTRIQSQFPAAAKLSCLQVSQPLSP
jgi:hypothetical protein